MSLNITIINPFGAWQCSDHKLTESHTGKSVADYSVKHVVLQCPDGAAALAYAGAGQIHDIDISDWIRETLRGEIRTLDQSLILLRENSSRDLGPVLAREKIRHMFSVAAFLGGRPWLVQIRNFSVPAPNSMGSLLDHFITVGELVPTSGRVAAFGRELGAVVTDSDWTKLEGVADRRPRRPSDFSKLLAEVNRRVATSERGRKWISPHCVTTYLPPEGMPVRSVFHAAGGPPLPTVIPMLLFGIDSTDMENSVLAQLQALKTGSLPPTAADLDRARKEAVNPKNRLRIKTI